MSPSLSYLDPHPTDHATVAVKGSEDTTALACARTAVPWHSHMNLSVHTAGKLMLSLGARQPTGAGLNSSRNQLMISVI
tara:strand:- start:335 stop:571 length:237 start_codon:yes stop_codon:yes gene_type:complete